MAAPNVLHPSVLSFQTAVKTVERWVQEEPTDEEKLKFLRQIPISCKLWVDTTCGWILAGWTGAHLRSLSQF